MKKYKIDEEKNLLVFNKFYEKHRGEKVSL